MTLSKHTWVVMAEISYNGRDGYRVRPIEVKARGEVQARERAHEYAILQDIYIKRIVSAKRDEVIGS